LSKTAGRLLRRLQADEQLTNDVRQYCLNRTYNDTLLPATVGRECLDAQMDLRWFCLMLKETEEIRKNADVRSGNET
jgi:hypothetical protein